MNRDTAVHLEESPLGKQQKIKDDGPDHVVIEVGVPDTSELRWWLLGLGQNVEVLAPKDLRDELQSTIRRMQKLYAAPEGKG